MKTITNTKSSFYVAAHAIAIHYPTDNGFDVDVFPNALAAALSLVDAHIVRPDTPEDMDETPKRAREALEKVHASINEGLEGIALDPIPPLPALFTGSVLYDARTAGAIDVLVERRKQIDKYGDENDDAYPAMALAIAANASIFMGEGAHCETPDGITMENRGHRENLVRAAAFLIAEIDKMDRARIKFKELIDSGLQSTPTKEK